MRFVEVEVRETGGGVLWTGQGSVPLYTADHNAGDDWSAAQSFTWNFSPGDFGGGTEGTPLTFSVGSSAQRGLYVDNIVLSVIPEPSAAALLGLAGLGGLVLRRRRR